MKCLKVLLRQKLVHHDNSKYDGYRLTPLGYDFLALKTLVNRGVVTAVGRQIGVGKESDVFEVGSQLMGFLRVVCFLPGVQDPLDGRALQSEDLPAPCSHASIGRPPGRWPCLQVIGADGEVLALKLHRLGRTSFRAVKSKRDYLRHRRSFRCAHATLWEGEGASEVLPMEHPLDFLLLERIFRTTLPVDWKSLHLLEIGCTSWLPFAYIFRRDSKAKNNYKCLKHCRCPILQRYCWHIQDLGAKSVQKYVSTCTASSCRHKPGLNKGGCLLVICHEQDSILCWG